MDKKKALMEVQIQLGNIELAQESIKSIKEALKDEFGKEEAEHIVELAKLLNKDKYHSVVEKTHSLENLYSEIMGE